MSSVDQHSKSFKVVVSIYHVWIPIEECFQVAVSIYHLWISTVKVLKLRCLYIMCGLLK